MRNINFKYNLGIAVYNIPKRVLLPIYTQWNHLFHPNYKGTYQRQETALDSHGQYICCQLPEFLGSQVLK
jgi:hypothetical protein